jgi:hypothetical protein
MQLIIMMAGHTDSDVLLVVFILYFCTVQSVWSGVLEEQERNVFSCRVTELFQIDGEVACNKEVCHLWRTV